MPRLSAGSLTTRSGSALLTTPTSHPQHAGASAAGRLAVPGTTGCSRAPAPRPAVGTAGALLCAAASTRRASCIWPFSCSRTATCRAAREPPRRLSCPRAAASRPVAVVSAAALRAPARDDTQSSAAVLGSRLVSAVGASMSFGARACGQHAAGPAACAVSDVRLAQLTQAGRATDERAVRVARRSLRSPGRRIGHALGHGRVWCPRFESEKPSRDGIPGQLEPKTPRFPDRRRRARPVDTPPTRHLATRRDPASNRDTGIFSRVELLLSQNDLQAFPRS
jgi:hypothetical protein